MRIEVPLDVRSAYGKAVVFESLKTTDARAATRLGLQRLADLHTEWEDIRRRHNPTSEDLRRIANAVYLDRLEDDRRRRSRFASSIDIEEAAKGMTDWSSPDQLTDAQLEVILAEIDPDSYGQEREATAKALRSNLRSGSPALLRELQQHIEKEVEAAIRRERLDVQPGSDAYRDIRQAVQRAWLEALDRAAERDAGEWGGRPKDEIVTLPETPPMLVAAPGEAVMEQFERYAKANPNGVKSDTLAYSRACVQLFADMLPSGFPASAIDKKAVRDWYDLLKEWPVKAAEIREFRDKSPREVLELNKTAHRPVISTRTQNKYMSALGSFCAWLVKRGVLNDDPTTGFYDRVDKDESPVRSYTVDELDRIFRSPVFTGALSSKRDREPGDVPIRDHRFWLPLIALFTGCRLGEIAQLLVKDIQEMYGRMVFQITPEGGGKSIKSKSGRRVIPIHPELVRVGLLSYWEGEKASGSDKLFPEIVADTRSQISGKPSRWYGRYVAAIGVKTDRTVNFHSYRHSLADACRRAGYLDREFGFILGHADQGTSVTRGYGILPEGNLQRRVEIIESVTYPDLDISHLYQP